MSEIPETPTNAARALIVWFAGAWAFESVHAFGEGSYVASAGYGLVAVVVAIMDFKLPSLLADNPGLTKHLNRISGDARWWVGIALVSILVIAGSPFIRERRWPFSPPTFAGVMVPPKEELPHNQLNLKSALLDQFSPGTSRSTADVPYRDKDGKAITIQISVFSDPHNGAQFLGVYIPATSSTVDIVKSVIGEHQALLRNLSPPKGTVTIIAKGEHGSISTDNVRFTGKIFVYHEQLLSSKEYSEIDEAAGSAGVSVTPRDPSFLTK